MGFSFFIESLDAKHYPDLPFECLTYESTPYLYYLIIDIW